MTSELSEPVSAVPSPETLPIPCVIAAPFAAGDDLARVRLNIARAAALGRLAEAHGYVPMVPHLGVAMLFGCDDNPENRAKSLKLCLQHLDLAAQIPGAWLLVLTDEDGQISPGVRGEFDRWSIHRNAGRKLNLRADAWRTYRSDFALAGLLDLWRDPAQFFWRAPIFAEVESFWHRQLATNIAAATGWSVESILRDAGNDVSYVIAEKMKGVKP